MRSLELFFKTSFLDEASIDMAMSRLSGDVTAFLIKNRKSESEPVQTSYGVSQGVDGQGTPVLYHTLSLVYEHKTEIEVARSRGSGD